MPTWGELLIELKTAAQQHGPAMFDVVRRKYLVALQKETGRNVILYASKWTQPGSDPGMIQITVEDVQAFMEVIHGLDGTKGLDLIMHSPGGAPDAAEAVVHYLRSKFDDIRMIVPHAAMSAATMMACASDRIVMGKHSSLGPIDPQFVMVGPNGAMAHPAQAILDQFEMAKQEVSANPALLGAWAPILPQFGPSLLIQCRDATRLSEQLVEEWLSKWMFKAENDPKGKATAAAKKLADHSHFKSHGRPIHRDAAKALGLVVEDLETNQQLQDLVLSVFHATTHTFAGTPAVKIVENHIGKAYVKTQQVQQVMQLMQPKGPGQPGLPGPQPAPPGPPQGGGPPKKKP